MGKYAIGLDYGTLSVRALLLNMETGEETASAVYEYPHGVMEHALPDRGGEKLPAGFALQDPADYLEGMEYAVRSVMKQAGCRSDEVLGIGLDVTSSTVMPVRKDGVPLCFLPEFAREPHAYVKLWKHHGAEEEARLIEKIARERGESWLSLYGGKVSSEWMIPKILETCQKALRVYEAADRFMEALDWLVWQLTGQESRSACGAGYKAFYHHEMGYPSNDFFTAVDPGLDGLVEKKLDVPAEEKRDIPVEKKSDVPAEEKPDASGRKTAALVKGIGETAGYLTESMAQKLGLSPGIPVGTAIIDAHAAVVGSGVVKPGVMMIIVGTSSCHMLLSETEKGIPGVAGIVKDGLIPGFFGYEAGQCCVGDHFDWFVKNCVPASYKEEAEEKGLSLHQLLVRKLDGYRAGQSGLLALDWFNGVRSPLMDFNLNGLILGLNLNTKPEEIYRALIEATAYGTRMIIENFEEAGVPVASIVLGGGIPAKNEMLVQIYADVCKKEIRLAGSANASARGAAILGAAAAARAMADGVPYVAAQNAASGSFGFTDLAGAVSKLGAVSDVSYRPNPQNVAIYDRLYGEYKILHEYFGKGANDVMKRLNEMRNGSVFAEQILADLIAEGLSGDELLAEFKRKQAKVRPAVEAMISEAENAALGNGEYVTYDELKKYMKD